MDYPKDILDIGALVLENSDILVGTYEASLEELTGPGNVGRLVEAFRVLKDHAEDLDGPMLQLLAACARIIYRENLYSMRDEAEPVHFTTHVRCEAA